MPPSSDSTSLSLYRRVAAALLLSASSACAPPPDTRSAPHAPSASNAPDTPAQSCTPDAATPKRQFRAAWIASVVNLDWPSRPGLAATRQQDELRRWFDEAARMHHNAVIVQVRPAADAFWPSPFEPWSTYLTGRQGTDPGYDPLAFAVAEAHRRNLEFHAWFNPFRLAMSSRVDTLAATHPARAHPDWIVRYGGKLYYNPGIPAARAFVIDAIMDAVGRYDIDGVHLDDYFYPYPVRGKTFDDAAAYARYGANFPTLAAWRRHNVDRFIEALAQRIKAAKPWVKFGVSPFAVWRNASTDPLGSPTRAGIETYDDLYADTRRWVREGWLDYVAPQVYWARGFPAADYDQVVAWWAEQVRGRDVHLYIGQAAFKVGKPSRQSPGWADADELSKHLAANRAWPEVQGDIYFSAKDVRADSLGAMSRLTRTWYSRPALVPVMASPGVSPPAPVDTVQVERAAGGARLQWQPRPAAGATAYAIYRSEQTPLTACDRSDARHLLATVRGVEYVDATARADRGYHYEVTALDRFSNESAPAEARLAAASGKASPR
jgi:uncharacterized lipoprotein YddW (UPF0748 family)